MEQDKYQRQRDSNHPGPTYLICHSEAEPIDKVTDNRRKHSIALHRTEVVHTKHRRTSFRRTLRQDKCF